MDLPLQKIGIVANKDKATSRDILRQAIRLIEQSGRACLLDPDSYSLLSKQKPDLTVYEYPVLAAHADLLLVIGGDGTMLKVARDTSSKSPPILGINAGRLGFLTSIAANQMESCFQALWDGKFSIEKRPLISAKTTLPGPPLEWLALNDFVISRGLLSRLIELEIFVDGEALTRYRGDGLIVSTPTGSTAYSLAAGGPIVSPKSEVFVLTPICPHTLSNRSVVVSLKSSIEVRLISDKLTVQLAGDGQMHQELSKGNIVTIRKHRSQVRLIRLQGYSFFQSVRQKLQWSGSAS